jgi:hypothetical protein
MSKTTMRCTVAICIAALLVLMGPASMAQSGRVAERPMTTYDRNSWWHLVKVPSVDA